MGLDRSVERGPSAGSLSPSDGSGKGSLRGKRAGGGATGPLECWCQLRQTSAVSVTFPEAGTVAVRFAPLSQVTLPDPSLRTYL